MTDRNGDKRAHELDTTPTLRERTAPAQDHLFIPAEAPDHWGDTAPLPGVGRLRRPAPEPIAVPETNRAPQPPRPAPPPWIDVEPNGRQPEGERAEPVVPRRSPPPPPPGPPSARERPRDPRAGLRPDKPASDRERLLIGALMRGIMVGVPLLVVLVAAVILAARWPLALVALVSLIALALAAGWLVVTGAGQPIDVTVPMRIWGRLRNFWRARVGLILCPYCFGRLRVGECALVRARQHLVGRPHLAVQEVKVGAANGPLGRLARGLRARQLTGRRAVEQQLRWACPHCGNALPLQIERLESRIIGIVGESQSGKSHYIAALIKWLTEESGQRGDGLEDVGLKRPTALDSVIDARYQQEYHDRLFLNHTALATTSPSEGDLASGSPGNLPLIYEVICTRQRPWKRLTWEQQRAVNLVLYDAPGEQLRNSDELLAHHQYVLNADGLIYLIDPLALPRLDRVLPPADEPAPNGARGVGEEEVAALPAGGQGLRGPIPLLRAVSRLLAQYRSVDPAETLPVAIAMTLAKVDLLEHDPERPLDDDEPVYDREYDPESAERRDYAAWIESVLVRAEAGGLVAASKAFNDRWFTGVSATGKASRTVLAQNPQGDPVQMEGYDPPIEPHRVLEPLMWLLWKLGYIGRSS